MLKICSQSIGRPSRFEKGPRMRPSYTPPALAAATASRVRDEISAPSSARKRRRSSSSGRWQVGVYVVRMLSENGP